MLGQINWFSFELVFCPNIEIFILREYKKSAYLRYYTNISGLVFKGLRLQKMIFKTESLKRYGKKVHVYELTSIFGSL
jgi:hypothetical protein